MDWFEQGLWRAKTVLKSFALKLYMNVDDADDAVQQTFVQAIAHRGSFTRGTNLDGWLMTIMMNKFRAMKRSSHAKRMTFTDDPRYSDHVPSADNPERSLIVKEMMAAVDRLPTKMREPIILMGCGCAQAEVAEMLDVPQGSIKSRVFRGREKLVEMTGGL